VIHVLFDVIPLIPVASMVLRGPHEVHLFCFCCLRIRGYITSKRRGYAHAMDPVAEAITVAEYHRHARVLRKRAEHTRRARAAEIDRLYREAFATRIAARAARDAEADARRQGQKMLTRWERLG
jgi:hypothetical protein